MKTPSKQTTAELQYNIRDLSETIVNQVAMVAAGFATPKIDQYWAEFFAVEAEIRARKFAQ